MFNSQDPFQKLENNLDTGDGPGKKQLIAGSIILFLIIFLAFGFWYWQKGNNIFGIKDIGLAGVDFAKDTDGDGLFDEEEKVWGTDINNSDTDRDGYSDSEEIRKGYNPNGEGLVNDKINSHSVKMSDKASVLHEYNSLSQEELERIKKECIGIIDLYERNVCFRKQAKMLLSPDPCQEISIEFVKDFCVIDIARETENEELCLTISDAKKDYCYHLLAVRTGDGFICQKNEDISRYDCFSEVAGETGDPKWCSYIDGEDSQKSRDICYHNTAIRSADDKICGKIKNRERQEECMAVIPKVADYRGANCEKFEEELYKNNCYFDKSVHDLDSSLCEKITDPYYKKECFEAAAHNLFEPTLCEKGNQSNIENCKKIFAKFTGDYLLCEKFSQPNADDCVHYVAGKANDLEICPRIKDSLKRDDCFAGIAACITDPKICPTLTNQIARDKCYFVTGPQQRDVSLCSEIIDKKARMDCYFFALWRDYGKCESINDSLKKNECHEVVKTSCERRSGDKKMCLNSLIATCNALNSDFGAECSEFARKELSKLN